MFGYKIENKKWVLDPFESEIVKYIFSSYYNGKKTKEIVNELNNKGIKTKTNTIWTINNLTRLLKNQKYTGDCIIEDALYENIYPAIIEKSVFERCKLIMENHKHKQRKLEEENRYILSGKLYCGNCFNLMTAETGTSKTGAIHHYYKCYTKKKDLTKCNKENVKQEWIEDLVFNKTREYVLQHKIIDNISNIVVEKFNSEISKNFVVESLQKDLQAKEKAISSMLDAIEKGIVTKSTQERLLALESAKAEIEDKLEIEKSHSIKPLKFEDVKNFLILFAKKEYKSTAERNDFFNNFIKRVILYDDKITIVYNTSLDPANEVYFPRNNNYDNFLAVL